MEDDVSKIIKDLKKRSRKKAKDNNITGNLIKSSLEKNIKKESEDIIAKDLKTNLDKVANEKSAEIIYKLIKERVQESIKEGLGEYAAQKSKNVIDSTTETKKEEMKRKIGKL